MNLQRIAKQLKREVRSNPIKAGLLGLLVLVGLYAWAPLVVDWISPEQEAAVEAKRSPRQRPGRDLSSGGKKAESKLAEQKNEKRWQDVVESIAQDQRMTSARYLPAMRNPFMLSPEELALLEQKRDTADKATFGEKSKQANAVHIEKEVTPSQLGIELTGTIIGRHRRVALFDDQVIPEGGSLTLRHPRSSQQNRSKDGADGDRQTARSRDHAIVFVVREIYADSVRLTRKGKKYQLYLPRNSISDRLADTQNFTTTPNSSKTD